MPRWLRITTRIIGALAGLVLLAWLGVAAYVYTHKKELLQTITDQLNENLNGKLTIENMEPALIMGFPGISVELQNVQLRDSLWAQHRHDLLHVKTIYVSVDAFSIMGGSPRIRELNISKGEIYLYTDSLGNSNTNLFRKTPSADSTTKKKDRSERINRIKLSDVVLTVDNQFKKKYFKFNVGRFLGEINYDASAWHARVRIKALVKNFEFNTRKGSFMKEKTLETDLKMEYDHTKHALTIPIQNMVIGGDDFTVGATFSFLEGKQDFSIRIIAPKILFKNAAALLTPPIRSQLAKYNLKEPINAQATIEGNMGSGGEPHIQVNMDTKDNTLGVLGGTVNNCSFRGSFNNQLNKTLEADDPNSAISIYNLQGDFRGVPFRADSIQILNLKSPVFTGLFKSEFELKKFNAFTTENFNFSSGSASLSILYKAPYNQNSTGQRYIFGTMKIKNAAARYIPRNLSFRNTNMTLNFKGRDLSMDDMTVQTQSTTLHMQGFLKDISNLYYTDPERIKIDWNISSPRINLNEFLGFLGKRKATVAKKSEKSFSNQLNAMLGLANMRMRVKVNEVVYKKFVATNLRSDIEMKKAGISLHNLSFAHGGGAVKMDADIDQSGAANRVNVNAKISNVDVQRLFYSFDNFGQTGITGNNLRGNFYGGTSVSATISNDGQVVPRSFKGTVDFDLRNGALINFEPLRKIGSLVFRNRDVSNIQFSSLKNTLDIEGDKIHIRPMEIESSVLNIFVDGVYSLSKGTDIAMRVPLRNPKKDELILDKDEKAERALKGIVINVRAVDGEDGKVKFKLGKRAEKE